MQLDRCQVVYLYRLVHDRLDSIDRRLMRLKRYSHDDEPIQRWLDEQMSLEHEKKKLTLLLSELENERFEMSESSIRNK